MTPMERNIELCIDADTYTGIAEITGNAELFKAIGYLSQWNMNHAKVRIIAGLYSGNPELIATYWKYNHDEPQPVTFQIVAVWRDDHFGFHS